jgi:hypothetical protein
MMECHQEALGGWGGGGVREKCWMMEGGDGEEPVGTNQVFSTLYQDEFLLFSCI